MQSPVWKQHPDKFVTRWVVTLIAAVCLAQPASAQQQGQEQQVECNNIDATMWRGQTLQNYLASNGTPSDSGQLVSLDNFLDAAHFYFSPAMAEGGVGAQFNNKVIIPGVTLSVELVDKYMKLVQDTVNATSAQSFASCVNKNLYRKYIIAALVAYFLSNKDSSFLKKTESYANLLVAENDTVHFVFWGLYVKAMNSLAKAEEVKKQNEQQHLQHLKDYEISVHRLWTEAISKIENTNPKFRLNPKNGDLALLNKSLGFACAIDYDPDFSSAPNQLYRLMYLLVVEYPAVVYRVKTPYSLDVIFSFLTDRFFCENPSKEDSAYYTTSVRLVNSRLRNETSDNLGVSYVAAMNVADSERQKMDDAFVANNFQDALSAYRKSWNYFQDAENYAQSKKGKSWVQAARMNLYYLWLARLRQSLSLGGAAVVGGGSTASSNAVAVLQQSEAKQQAAAQLDVSIEFYRQIRAIPDKDMEQWPNQFNKDKYEKSMALRELSTRITLLSFELGNITKITSQPNTMFKPGALAYSQGIAYFDDLLSNYAKEPNNSTQTRDENQEISNIAFFYAGLLYQNVFNDLRERAAVSDQTVRTIAIKNGGTSLRLFPFNMKHLLNYINFLRQNSKGFLVGEIKRYYVALNTLLLEDKQTNPGGLERQFMQTLDSIFDDLELYDRCERNPPQISQNPSAQQTCQRLLTAVKNLEKISGDIAARYQTLKPDDTQLSLLRRLVDKTSPLPL